MAQNRSSRPNQRDAAQQPDSQPDQPGADQAETDAPEAAPADPTAPAPATPTADGAPATPSATTTGDASAATNGDQPKEKRPYNRQVIKDIPLDELGEAEDVPEAEWEQTPLTDSGTTDRGAAQMKIDADFKDLFDKWVAAGKPEPRKSPRSRRAVPPEHGPAIKRMITNAAKLYDVVAKFSPVAHDQQGRYVIVYSPVPKVSRPRKPSALPEGTTLATAESKPSPAGGSLPGE
jgi:hypothetical protein